MEILPPHNTPSLPGRGATTDHISREVKSEELLRYLLTGYTLKEAARLLSVSYNTCWAYANQPIFRERLKKLSADIYAQIDKELTARVLNAKARIDELSLKALDRLEQLMDSEKESIALKACDSVLDRNADTATNKRVDGTFTNFNIDPANLMLAAMTAQELDSDQ